MKLDSETVSRDNVEISKNESFWRCLFLTSLGGIFGIAFWSYYTPYPGLSSVSGLEPAVRLMPYAAPEVYRYFVQPGFIDTDTLCELVACLGIILSCIVVSGWIQHGVIFVVLTAMYSFLASVGGAFYSFQWDTLLAETGAVTAICYAPWNKLRCSRDEIQILSAWPLRFLLFKLMFMSGVVKIQSECPTWTNLTALEFHFATQCLPGPLAWYAHQLPPFLLRLSVAITFLIEIPATIFLLAPFVTIRRFGAMLQILLQTMIMLTGNYNFFNLLTMALCFPCIDKDAGGTIFGIVKIDGSNSNMKWFMTALQHIVSWSFLGWSFKKMFVVAIHNPTGKFNISLLTTKEDCNSLSEWLVPMAVITTVAIVGERSIRSVWSRRTSPLTLLRAIVCITTIGIMAVPFCDISPSLRLNGFFGSKVLFKPLWYNYAQPHRLANGYGLFRRMTGVGNVMTTSSLGWAGVPPSIVARPEIVIEGLFPYNATNRKWKELEFRWKPGSTRVMPLQVAPHQPRLDWQMWFAALGNYQHNPWFIHLIQKILDGCEPVLDLMGDPKLLVGNGEGDADSKLTEVRSKLYKYDFTRMNTEWNRRIPNVRIVEKEGNDSNNTTTTTANFWSSLLLTKPDVYWKRKYERMYMPRISTTDNSIKDYLQKQGYQSICIDSSKRCNTTPTRWCHLAWYIRQNDLHITPILALLFYFAKVFSKATHERSANKTKTKRQNDVASVSEEKKNQ